MSNRISLMGALVVTGFIGSLAAAGEPTAKDRPSLSQLSLEVTALQTMHRFKMTTAQLTALRKLAPDAPRRDSRANGKGSDKLRTTLTDLRDALLKGDEERIEEMEDQLSDLLEAEEFDLDDMVALTPAAHRRATEVLFSLSPRQVGSFFNHTPEEQPDPLERLLGTLDVAGKMSDVDWKEVVESIVDDLSWQIGGLDPTRSKAVGEKIEQFLKKVRSTKDIAKQRNDLEMRARQIVMQVSPTFMLHNVAEHALAELLSNPRLAAMLDARLNK